MFLVTENKNINSDINEELLIPFFQENIKNATLNTVGTINRKLPFPTS